MGWDRLLMAGGLFRSLGRLLSSLLGLVEARLELLVAEAEEVQLRFLTLLALTGLGLLFMALAIVLAAFFVAVLFWDTHRLPALGILFSLFLALGSGLLWEARRRVRRGPRLFSRSLAELKRDRKALDQD